MDIFERVQREVPGARALRMRNEHAQILDRAEIPRFASLNVIASMQPTHATSDMPWVPARIGRERMEEGAYVWRDADGGRSDDRQRIGLPGRAGRIRCSASTRPSRGRIRWDSLRQAGCPASACRARRRSPRSRATPRSPRTQKHSWARSKSGKLADLVVLSKDIMRVAPPEILTTSVRMTIVGGEIVYSSTP